jgi:hypothetical protein
LDRQDIDALLVGALYGELSSADEAALTAHLDSHPADRNALDDLKSIRTKFKTSRIFELQFEPPQALSALLLQEAARRAPKIEVRKESWFQRFVTLFVAHPAMAAAATLVLVVGVAGTVYVKSDKQVEVTASQNDDITRLQPPPASAVAWGSAAMGGNTNDPEAKEAAAGEGQKAKGQDTVAVGLAEEQGQKKLEDVKETGKDVRKQKVAELKTQSHTSVATPKRDELAFDGDAGGKRETPAEVQQAPAKKPAPAKPYVEVGSNDRAPKDFERSLADDKVAASDAPATGAAAGPSSGNGAPGNTRAGTATVASNTVAKPPAQNAPAVSAAPAAPEPPPPPAATKATRPDTNLAWAKDTHARVTALVKEGKCQAAAPLAIAIRNRTPDYYNSYVATDRELKPCMPYITDATEHSERSSPKAAAKATDTK